MIVKFIEATNGAVGGYNWGKFAVCRFEPVEWAYRSAMPGALERVLLARCGWALQHLLVLDVQTGEGAFFRPGGLAAADLNEKHRIWVCPMFEPFLAWLYKQDLGDLATLPALVDLEAASAMSGYRRRAPAEAETIDEIRAERDALRGTVSLMRRTYLEASAMPATEWNTLMDLVFGVVAGRDRQPQDAR